MTAATPRVDVSAVTSFEGAAATVVEDGLGALIWLISSSVLLLGLNRIVATMPLVLARRRRALLNSIR